MRVSLVTTVRDITPAHARDFLDSLRAQTRAPDESIVVDGGSTDGTYEAFAGAEGVVALREPGAGISRGRNVGIEAAAHDILALTDADCVLDPEWLARIVAPLEDPGVAAVAGFYRPLARTRLQQWAAAISLPEPDEIRPGWLPSSRSIAFRRSTWEAAGRYPEWLEVGEDMYFNHRVLDAGCAFALAPDAVVHWRVRPTLAATWRQYARYSEGDAVAGMYAQRHAIRFATYAFGAAAVASRRPALLAAAAIGAAIHVRAPLRRAWRRLDSPANRAASMVAVPAMLAFVDAAKMAGYLRGVARQTRSDGLQTEQS